MAETFVVHLPKSLSSALLTLAGFQQTLPQDLVERFVREGIDAAIEAMIHPTSPTRAAADAAGR